MLQGAMRASHLIERAISFATRRKHESRQCFHVRLRLISLSRNSYNKGLKKKLGYIQSLI
jgi:hypothetical protein